MGDWRKTQYRIGPEPDPLADPMAAENFWFGVLGWSVIVAFLGAVALLVWGLFF